MGQKIINSIDHYTQYKNRCGWDLLLPEYQPRKTLCDDISADVLIIGAGYTGIAAAKKWSEICSDDRIAIIDASVSGENNSGRNSGFLLEVSLANDADAEQINRMKECNLLIEKSAQKIFNEVKDSAIDCQIHRAGTYRAAASELGKKSLRDYEKFLKKSGLEYDRLNKDQLEEKLGTNYYSEGLYNPHCYLAQPAALIRALIDKLPKSINLYENTPALSIKQDKKSWLIITPKASIRSKKIVIANNAFCAKLGFVRSYISPIYTYAAITEPLQENELFTLGTETNWGILPAHRLGSTLRLTIDGRLMIRSLYDYGYERNNVDASRQLRKSLKLRFPQLTNINFESVWGGTTGFTYNGGPIWGEIENNIYISAGCNGGGIVKGTLFGELLAMSANQLKVPEIKKLFGSASRMPPEPFRKIGFKLISMIESKRAKKEI